MSDICIKATTNGQGVCFYLLELKKYFELNICDVMLTKNSLIQHFTRIYKTGRLIWHVFIHASLIFLNVVSYVEELETHEKW